MKGRWFVLGVCGLILGFAGRGSTSHPVVPPEVAELLPYALILWQSTVYETLGDPVTVVGVGDVNGDGILDIVGSTSQEIRIFAGQKDGKFTEMPCLGYYKTEPRPDSGFQPAGKFWPICGDLADLDGDGAPDLVVAVIDENAQLTRIYVFRNTQGTFIEDPVSLVLPFTTEGTLFPLRRLWARDLNGDGIVDLLLKRQDPEAVYLLPGKSGLKWGPLTLVKEVKGFPIDLVDVDGDSALDLAFYTEEGAFVLFGDGQGRFPFQASFSPPDRSWVYDVGVGDLDGDGDLDLLLLTGKSLIAEIQEDRAFRLGEILDAQGATDLIVADFTGDGALDALIGKQDLWRLLPGDGQGGFLGVASEHQLLGGPWRASDLNQDGLADLLPITRPSYDLKVCMNGGLPKGESRIPFGGNALLAVGELSGNGAPDLLVAGKGYLEVLWNNGKGGLLRGRLFQGELNPVSAKIAGGRIYLLSLSRRIKPEQDWLAVPVGELWVLGGDGKLLARHELGENWAPGFAIGDLDGDGGLDVLALCKREIVVLWGGSEVERFPWGQGELSLAWAGDLDGDGVDEVGLISTAEYAEVYLLRLSYRKLTVSGPVLQLAAVPLALSGGDLDGDGLSDLAALSLAFVEKGGRIVTTASLGLLLSRMGPKDIPIPNFPARDSPLPLTGLAVGDFDGDGLGDVAYSLVSGTGLYVLPGKGDGTFGEANWLEVWAGPVFAADLDGNGQDDIIASTAGLAPHLWILWNGGGR